MSLLSCTHQGMAPSSRGLGHGPFKAATRVRIPSGSIPDLLNICHGSASHPSHPGRFGLVKCCSAPCWLWNWPRSTSVLARGLVPLGEQLGYLASEPIGWTVGWAVWMSCALALIAFLAAVTWRLGRRARLANLGLTIAVVGAAFDLFCDSIYILVFPGLPSARQFPEERLLFLIVERVTGIGSVVIANGALLHRHSPPDRGDGQTALDASNCDRHGLCRRGLWPVAGSHGIHGRCLAY